MATRKTTPKNRPPAPAKSSLSARLETIRMRVRAASSKVTVTLLSMERDADPHRVEVLTEAQDALEQIERDLADLEDGAFIAEGHSAKEVRP